MQWLLDGAQASSRTRTSRIAHRPAASPWTPEDERRVLEGYEHLGAAYLAVALGRSLKAVQSKAQELGAVRPGGWTTTEINRLKALVAAGYSNPEIAATLGRTVKSVQQKCARLGVVRGRKHASREWFERENARGPGWAPWEDDVLRSNQGKIPLREIHRRFFVDEDGEQLRSYAAVAQRIGALGLSLDRKAALAVSLRHRRENEISQPGLEQD